MLPAALGAPGLSQQLRCIPLLVLYVFSTAVLCKCSHSVHHNFRLCGTTGLSQQLCGVPTFCLQVFSTAVLCSTFGPSHLQAVWNNWTCSTAVPLFIYFYVFSTAFFVCVSHFQSFTSSGCVEHLDFLNSMADLDTEAFQPFQEKSVSSSFKSLTEIPMASGAEDDFHLEEKVN